MMAEVSAEYARLIETINSSTYSTLPEAVQKSIRDQAAFYEKNWNLGSTATNMNKEESLETYKQLYEDVKTQITDPAFVTLSEAAQKALMDKATYYSQKIEELSKPKEEPKKTETKVETYDPYAKIQKQHGKVQSYDPFNEFMKNTNLTYEAEQVFDLFELALKEKWIQIDKDGKITAVKVTNDIIQKIREALQIKSPSRVAYGIMDYFMQGIDLGIHDGMDAVFKTLTELTSGMIKTTDEGLESLVPSIGVMADSLTKDIQPQITPIFDDSAMSFGVSALSKSFDGLSSKVTSTANSFQDKSGRNNGQLDVLSGQVASMAGLINSFMQMVADGELININVNAEADPNNIYELVVNTNRQKFKQTGKNPLSY